MRRPAARFHSRSLINVPSSVYYDPLLDQTNVPGVATSSGGSVLGAWALRKLRAAYTGNCLTVQRADNNATAVIGFNTDGSFDRALIASHCGSAEGFIRVLNDQSGNGYDMTAVSTTDTTHMYRIWSGTAIDLEGAQAALKAIAKVSGTDTKRSAAGMKTAAFTTQTGTAMTVAMVGAISNTGSLSIRPRMFSLFGASAADNTDSQGLLISRAGSTTASASWEINRAGSSPGLAATAGTYDDIAQVDAIINGSACAISVEGTTTTGTLTSAAFAATTASIGWSGNAYCSDGGISEVVAWNVALTSDQLTAVRTNQSGYWQTSSASSNPSGSDPGGTPGSGGTNLPGWNLVLDEGFATAAAEGQFLSKYGSRWTAYSAGTPDTWGKTHTPVSQYGTNNISVANNTMYLRLFVNSSGQPVGAAPIPKFPGKDGYHTGYTAYRYEFKLRCLNPVQGWKVAYLLWPDTDIWTAEVDFPEGNLNSNVGGFQHWWNNVNSQDAYSSSFKFSDWHTYTVEWNGTSSMKWMIDGLTVKTMTSHLPGEALHGPILQTETVLSSSGRPIAGQTCTVEIQALKLWLPA